MLVFLFFSLKMHGTVFVLLCTFCAFGNAQNDWDYLMLSLRWPPTLCSFVECTPIPKPIDFVIHGLWPIHDGLEFPSVFTCDVCFNALLLRICQRLYFLFLRRLFMLPLCHYGLLVNGFSVLSFCCLSGPPHCPTKSRCIALRHRRLTGIVSQKHEWHDHGRCALENPIITDMVDYFNRSLQLRSKCDLLGRLTSVHVHPTNQTEYTYEHLTQVLHTIYGVRMKLYCLKRHHQTPHLFEIRICFNVNLDFIDCHDKHECGFSTYFVDTNPSCAATTRELVRGGSAYSAMPCPNGSIIFPPLVNMD
ncbi:ribonuclease T2 [Paragonimus westermani]|uniref:Ribonuclease T2 n=1 Tax=Paragonimus westermani TaxID=34504 RepID=A0A5J4NPD9_9TREM|nr:ribonuclease T2 [Paragonimus westermani]